MARTKRKADDPGRVQPPAAVPDAGAGDDVDKDADEDDEVDIRLVRSVVHDEFIQTNEEKETKKGGKKRKTVSWKSECKHCGKEFSHKKTSGLKRHLHSKHSDIAKMVEDTDDLAREAQKADRDAPLITKQAIIIEKYTKWLIHTSQPLNTSDNQHFVEFYKAFDEEIDIPGRFAITALLDKKFVDMLSKLRKRLADARRVHLTMDGWSNRRCRSSFLGATVHLYNPIKRCAESFRLCLRKFNCRHTGQAILEMTQKILDEFDIRHKTMVVNTDNGSNMRKAMTELSHIEIPTTEIDVNMNLQQGDFMSVPQAQVQDEFLPEFLPGDLPDGDEEDDDGRSEEERERDAFIKRLEDEVMEFDRNWRLFGITPLRCATHLLQLPIMKILRDKDLVFHDILVKVRAMVNKYSKSVNAKEELNKLVHLMVVCYCVTRWWTDCDMMARIKRIYEENPTALNSVIETMEWDEDLKLDKKDVTLINKFLLLFQPIQKMSEQLGGEKYSSIHMVLPIVKDIKDHIDSYKSDKLVGGTAKALSKEFDKYFRYNLWIFL